jgi:ABC-type transport system involved in cytochrome c biogenesis permease subunit
MISKISNGFLSLIKRAAAPAVTFYVLPYLILLLIAGTMAQKWIGLHGALEMYFYSWILWLGPLPLPGGLITMGALFINLLARFIGYSIWSFSRIGIHLAHFGVLLLLIGGIVSSLTRIDMVIPATEGETFGSANSYDQSVFTVFENDQPVLVADFAGLASGNLTNAELPFTLNILETCLNCRIELRPPQTAEDWQGPATKMMLVPDIRNIDPEMELPGLSFEIQEQKYLTFLGFPKPPKITLGDNSYRFEIRRKAHPLPFEIKLNDFEKTVYPGSWQPKSYHSDIEIIDGDLRFPARISMNDPLTYKGYTFYQSSFQVKNDGTEISVLAVVHNTGRLFPYIASLIIALGLILHIIIRSRGKFEPQTLKVTALFLTFLLTALPGSAQAIETGTDFASLPVLHDGRIKPLDSFARVNLDIFGSQGFVNDSANQILAHTLFDPASAIEQPIFRIKNPDILRALGLAGNPADLHSFAELHPGLQHSEDRFKAALEKQETGQDLDQFEQDLIGIHSAGLYYLQLLRSFSFTLPLEGSNDKALTRYTDLQQNSARLREQLNIIRSRTDDPEELSDTEREIARQNYQLATIGRSGQNNILFKVIPVQADQLQLVSPWQVITGGFGTPDTARFMSLWTDLTLAYQADNQPAWDQIVHELQTAYNTDYNGTALTGEYYYNQIQPFKIALGLALLAGGLLLIAAIQNSALLTRAGYGLALLSVIFQGLGILARVLLLMRPPVGTLYESVLFVAFILGTGLLLCRNMASGRAIVSGGFLTLALLLLFGQSLNQSRDHLQMLDAVLNTNFWLATHVLVVTMGYGWCFLTAVIAHIQLIGAARLPQPLNRDWTRPVHLHALIALLLVTIGTILGGIWADMSWGRFWGWDPKENGALLIVLWLLWLLHARLSRHVSALYYVAGMAFLSVIVMLSWFGVNLLSVGLHSYGFTSGVAAILFGFIFVQTVIIALLLILIHKNGAAENA